MRSRVLYLLVILFSIPLFFCTSCSKSKKTKHIIKYELEMRHQPFKYYTEKTNPILILEIQTSADIAQSTVLCHYLNNDSHNVLTMKPLNSNHYQVEIPVQKKGSISYYYFEITTPDGVHVYLPQKASDQKYFRLQYKGNLPESLKVFSVALTFILMVFFFIVLVLSIYYLQNGGSITKILHISLVGIALFMIKVLPIGVINQYIIRGTVYSGWPIGSSVVNTINIILVLFWLIIFFGMKNAYLGNYSLKNWLSNRLFVIFIAAGSIITIIFSVFIF